MKCITQAVCVLALNQIPNSKIWKLLYDCNLWHCSLVVAIYILQYIIIITHEVYLSKEHVTKISSYNFYIRSLEECQCSE